MKLYKSSILLSILAFAIGTVFAQSVGGGSSTTGGTGTSGASPGTSTGVGTPGSTRSGLSTSPGTTEPGSASETSKKPEGAGTRLDESTPSKPEATTMDRGETPGTTR